MSILFLLSLTSCAGYSNDPFSNSGGVIQSDLSDDVVNHTINFYLDGEIVKTVSVRDGAKLVAPTSDELPKGYIVDYWYVMEGSLKSPWSFTGGTVTSDFDLYANFTYETYDVKLISADGLTTYETSVSYKQTYDFSQIYGEYLGKRLAGFENENGLRVAVSGIWSMTGGAVLTPILGELEVSYEYYELSSPLEENDNGVAATTYEASLDGVSNGNPTVLSGKPANLGSSLEDAHKDGYRFEGWFSLEKAEDSSNGRLVWSFSKISSFYDGYLTSTIYGLFSRYYSVSVTSDDDEAGKIDFINGQKSSACVGDEISLKATPLDGYSFAGWFDGETCISSKDTYTFAMKCEDCSLVAKWSILNYKITYDLNGGENSDTNPSTYTVKDTVLLNDPTKAGYIFKGWYSDSSFTTGVTFIPEGTIGDKK